MACVCVGKDGFFFRKQREKLRRHFIIRAVREKKEEHIFVLSSRSSVCHNVVERGDEQTLPRRHRFLTSVMMKSSVYFFLQNSPSPGAPGVRPGRRHAPPQAGPPLRARRTGIVPRVLRLLPRRRLTPVLRAVACLRVTRPLHHVTLEPPRVTRATTMKMSTMTE